MPSSDLKGVPVSPLTGVMDFRSSPDQLPAGALRLRQNFQTVAQNKLRRGCGWRKFLSSAQYTNEDNHDQLLTFIPNGIRQPATLLFEAESSRGTRNLIVGRQSSISKLDEFTGNYRILGTGFGGTPSASAAAPRFKAAQVGDYLVFTNDFDKPMYHIMEANPIAPAPPLQTFAELDIIGLTRAAVCWEWHNCLFFADVVMDGDRFGYRIVWSDYNNPTSFDPENIQSITGFRDLFTYEKILAGRPFGSSFIVYTTHGIWEIIVVGGDQTFDFNRRFNGEDCKGTTVLRYPNTLAATPEAHVYAAEDGIYEYNPFFGFPKRPEWVHRGTGSSDNSNPLGIFDNIDSTNCQVHVAEFQDNEYLISTASKDAVNNCPDRTLRLNSAYDVGDVIDFGFTSFVSYRSYKVPSIRDFILSYGICDFAGLVANGITYANEGLPNPITPAIVPFAPDCIYTKVTQVIAGVTTEDWNQPHAAPTSLCALLGSKTLDDFCLKCESDTLLVGCASNDWCLKEIGPVNYRERCANPTAVGTTDSQGYHSTVGTYLLDGYDSILRFAPVFDPDDRESLVKLETLLIYYFARGSTQIGLRVGIGAQPVDPNNDRCDLRWFQHSLQDMSCLSLKELDAMNKEGTIPDKNTKWRVMRKGKVLCVELKISGTDGDVDISTVVADLARAGTARF